VNTWPRSSSAATALAATLLMASAAAPQPAPSEASQAPAQVVEALHAVLLEVMKNAGQLGYQGRYERLAPALNAAFDLPFMAQKSVGRHWKAAPVEDQEALVDTFTRYSIATYAGRFDHYGGGEFETLGVESSARGTMLVRTRILESDGEEVKLDYRLRNADGSWKILDVYLNGTVSELALRRSEYSSLIKREGFQALLAALDERIDSLANDALADRAS
jgi:phospholipid transport system substrate-binding protein